MGWQSRFHKKYLDYYETTTDYRPKNKYDDEIFSTNNDAIVKFSQIVNTIGGIEFTEYQLELLEEIFPYLVPMFYHKHWSTFGQAIRKMYKIGENDIAAKRIVSGTARREGKTTFYISIAASLILTMPTGHGWEYKIAMPAQRLSTAMETLRILASRLEQHPMFVDGVESGRIQILKQTTEVLVIVNESGSGLCEIHAFPDGDVSIGKWDMENSGKPIINFLLIIDLISEKIYLLCKYPT